MVATEEPLTRRDGAPLAATLYTLKGTPITAPLIVHLHAGPEAPMLPLYSGVVHPAASGVVDGYACPIRALLSCGYRVLALAADCRTPREGIAASPSGNGEGPRPSAEGAGAIAPLDVLFAVDTLLTLVVPSLQRHSVALGIMGSGHGAYLALQVFMLPRSAPSADS